MKKVLIVFFVSMAICVCQAKINYSIHDWQGQVFIKEYLGQSWSPVKKNEAVSGLDSVNISENGMLRVLDNSNNLIYSSIHPGKSRIIAIINEAKKHNSSMMASVNRELWENSTNISKSDRDLIMKGATIRGVNDTTKSLDKIANAFGWIAAQVLNDRLVNKDSNFVLKSHTNDDNTFFFELRNHMDRGFFVNVLHLNKSTKKVNLCYIINEEMIPNTPYLFLPKNETLLMNNILFSTDKENDVFIYVGTEDAYVPEQMQFLLKYLDIEKVMPLYDKYVYYIHK